jgi:hypothetical protein
MSQGDGRDSLDFDKHGVRHYDIRAESQRNRLGPIDDGYRDLAPKFQSGAFHVAAKARRIHRLKKSRSQRPMDSDSQSNDTFGQRRVFVHNQTPCPLVRPAFSVFNLNKS